jgi:aerotaxis receptor
MAEIERQFEFEELFFSRTTVSGVIQSGNSVFRKISAFDWSDLINKPHSLIRHPEMPRGIFYLFWETLKSGKPIGAYVKNRAKTGEYYWVYALAFPIENGYLSLRLKPSSQIFNEVKSVYKNLLTHEKEKKLSPKDSMLVILDQVTKLGFNTYEDFMTTCLVAELTSRNQKLMISENPLMERMGTLATAATRVNELSSKVNTIFGQYTKVPLNMEILAAHLGSDGASLSVVANRYEKMATEIKNKISDFITLNSQVTGGVKVSQFQVASSILQQEMIRFFKKESDVGPVDLELEMSFLWNLYNAGLSKATSAVKTAESVLGQFQSSCEELKQLSLGLEIVRLTGKIEASKINQRIPEVSHLLEELSNFKSSLSLTIDELDKLSNLMRDHAFEISNRLK